MPNPNKDRGDKYKSAKIAAQVVFILFIGSAFLAGAWIMSRFLDILLP